MADRYLVEQKPRHHAPVGPDGDRVFTAFAYPTRRFLLDLLFACDDRTLTELESELEMTRFGADPADHDALPPDVGTR